MNSRLTPNPVRNILVPVDFSPDSINALYYAATLASRLRSRLLITHISPVTVMVGSAGDNIHAAADELYRKLESEAISVAKEFPDLKVEISMSSGMIKDKILQTASVRNTDLIVMGTHGATSWRETLLGTNTADVIQSADIPVIAVPAAYRKYGFSRIAFATTYSDYDLPTLFRTTELFKPFNPEISVVNVEEDQDPETVLKQRREFASMVKAGITYDNIGFEQVKGEDAEHALHNYIESNKIDLVVTSARRRNIFERFTDRSLSRKMAFHSVIPLLVYHASNKTSYPFF